MHWTFLLAVEAAEAATKEGGLFDLNATLPLMALQFLLLVAVLNVFFYKPLGKAIDDRDNYIRSNQADARERLAKADALAKQYESELADARKKSQAVINAAKDEASKLAAQEVAKAQQEAQAQREQVQRELDQQKQAALQTLEHQVEGLSDQILAKLLGV